MQSKEGGWAAFDKDNTKSLIAKIPFADFGETLDPPSADVTAHVLEMLGKLGYTRSHPSVERGYRFLRKQQEDEGPWFGRWGVNYVYGTSAVLMAMEAIGEDMGEEYIRRAVGWLAEKQNSDGGWGETCGSYVDFSMAGVGPSTPSQTAWAILALLAAGEVDHPATSSGTQYLVGSQQEEGSWDESYYTGTGFPGYGIGKKPDRLPGEGERGHQGLDMPAGFMINYHMYRNCWPLMALGRYRRLTTLTDQARRSESNDA
jgi:squalene-hopene/tetraprenyl-beta-curcumene cyclase